MKNLAIMPDSSVHVGSLLREALPELDAALGLLHRLFDVRITFFDLEGVEAEGFEVKPLSEYCAARRRDPHFDARCRVCDRRHLEEAKGRRDICIYRCHDGLVEGVIPLYTRDGSYLGAIMFGQLRPEDDTPAKRSAQAQRQRDRLGVADPRRLRDLAQLLKWLSEHLATHAALRRPQLPWAESARRHLTENLGQRLTLAGLARVVGRSPSFLSHQFSEVFGTSFARHVRTLRLSAARERLAQGETLASIAKSLGFCDQFHLSRCYRKHFGHSPSRELHQER